MPVVLSDEADALAALPLIDIFDRAEFKRALRVSLKIRRRDTEAFDLVFEGFWSASPRETAVSRAAPDRRVPHASSRKSAGALGGSGPPGRHECEIASGDAPASSPEALLRRQSFADCAP